MLTSLVSHRICRRDLLESTHGPDGECRRLGRCSRGRRVAWARAREQRLPVPAATRGHAEAHLRARTSAGETLVAQRGSRLAREANPLLRPYRIRSPIWRCTRTSGSVTAWISPAVRPADCHLVSAAQSLCWAETVKPVHRRRLGHSRARIRSRSNASPMA